MSETGGSDDDDGKRPPDDSTVDDDWGKAPAGPKKVAPEPASSEATLATKRKSAWGVGERDDAVTSAAAAAAAKAAAAKAAANKPAADKPAKADDKAAASADAPKNDDKAAAKPDDRLSAVADDKPAVADDKPAVADDKPATVADDEPATKADDKPTVADDKPATVANDKPAAKADDKPAAKAGDQLAAKTDDKPAAKTGDKPAAKADDKLAANADDKRGKTAASDASAAARRKSVWGSDDDDAAKRDLRGAVMGNAAARGPLVSGRLTLLVFGIGAALVLSGAMIALSYFNSKGFFFVCEANRISAERGRWMPWGHSPMSGPAWKPIAKPPANRCTDARFETEPELKQAFANALRKQANAALGLAVRERPTSDALKLLDEQLVQALLLLAGTDQADQRKEIERLQGDVEYWRAAAEIREAIARLGKAADRFDNAAARAPRHSADADVWARYARDTTEDLKKGPPALREATDAGPGADGEDAKASGRAAATGAAAAAGEGDSADSDGDDDADGKPIKDAGPLPIPRGGVLL